MEHLRATETIVDSSLHETKKHGTDGFPFAVYLDDFSHFQNGYICWHWHDEVQFTLIIEGEFTCQIGSEKVILKPGESIFFNSCVLHQIQPNQKASGKLYSFIWQADILAGNPECDVYKNCIAYLLRSEQKYFVFDRENPNCKQMGNALTRIVNYMSEKQSFYQMRVYNQLSKIWLGLCDCASDYTLTERSKPSYVQGAKDEERVKNALLFMEENYGEDISLDDIAKAAMTSRSELCKSFRRTLDTSPKEFLLQYRIRQSLLLLENLDLRIADISEMTGFSSPSHFSSCFLKQVGCTPLQYRKNL